MVGRDGRAVKTVSAIEIAFGLKKTLFILLEKLESNRGYNIQTSKRRSCNDNILNRAPRHVLERRNIANNALTRAAESVEVVKSVRSFFKN